VEPGDIAGSVVVGQEGFGAKLKVRSEPRIVGEGSGLAELGSGSLDGVGECLAVRNGDESAGGVATDERVLAAESERSIWGLGAGGLELGRGHVGRIEPCAQWLRALAGHEW